MENAKVATLSAGQQSEWDKLANEGSTYTGGGKGGLFVPTIKLNNSDKVKVKTGVPLGNFILSWKDNQVEKFEDLDTVLAGVILKTSYSIKNIYDPNGFVSFYSQEFDDFSNSRIKVKDGKTSEIIFSGSYKQWKETHQIVSSRGSKNDFILVVHLYILQDTSAESPKVERLSISGKSMSNWFSYVSGDKENNIVGIYSKGIKPHTHIHSFESVEEKNPKGETYWTIMFSSGDQLTIDQLRTVVALQRDLDKQLQSMRGNVAEYAGVAEEKKPIAAALSDCSCVPLVKDGVSVHTDDCKKNELRLEDVPF